jgi:predicted permease
MWVRSQSLIAIIGLSHLDLRAVTIEAAMPPQLFTFIVADRFGFDTELLAAAVILMTVVSLFTVPIGNHFLT